MVSSQLPGAAHWVAHSGFLVGRLHFRIQSFILMFLFFSSSHLFKFAVWAELHLAKRGDVTASNFMKVGTQRQCN